MDFTSLASHGFNAVDLLLVAVLLLGVWRGWRVGFLTGALELASLAAGLVIAFFASPVLASTLDRQGWLPEPWASPTAFLGTFLFVQLLLAGLLRRLVRPLQAGPAMRRVNRALGLVPGTANGALNAMVAAVLLTALPLTDGITRAAQGSALVARLAEPADWLERHLGPIFNPPSSAPCRRSRCSRSRRNAWRCPSW